jgi:beta-glucosidase-like glycosyl hydrolase
MFLPSSRNYNYIPCVLCGELFFQSLLSGVFFNCNVYNRAMQNYYQFIVPRLNGSKIRKNFRYYRSLVKKGIAGFIVFGGELNTLKKHLADLQSESELPLIISADLERGLGQQVKGGTLFPPAMAMASAVMDRQSSAVSRQHLRLLRASLRAVATEARYAGINTIFGPVLDINTNPRNPIISVRAFGEDPETVSFFGCETIRGYQACGIAACGKHFPGHGDTEVDSHIMLPAVDKGLRRLKKYELLPFQRAIEENVKMIMLGHLKVPALDSSGTPVSISRKAVAFLREKLKFNGIVITDAMNMGGIGAFSEERAALMALGAGVDLLLHPTDPDKIVSSLEAGNIEFDAKRLRRFRSGLARGLAQTMPDFELHARLSDLLTEKAVRLTADFRTSGGLFLIVLDDDGQGKGNALVRALKNKVPSLTTKPISKGSDVRRITLPESAFVIAAVFSETKAWKGGASKWLHKQIAYLKDRADLFVSFGSPYVFNDIQGKLNGAQIFAYWDAVPAQRAVAKIIGERTFGS